MSRDKSKSQPFHDMYMLLNRKGLAEKYKTYKPGPGSIDLLYVNSDTREVEHCPLEELANEVIILAHRHKDVDLGPADARPMAHWWTVINNLEKGLKQHPLPVCERSAKELTFRRLPWDYIPYEKHKAPMHFLEFCNRCSDPDTLQAFIGSIFVPTSYRQQYLYLFGHGNDGKGTLFNLLHKMLGNTFIAENVPSKDAPFWSSAFIGKRLCVFPELEDVSFPSTERFRKLTGDDLIRFEEKYKNVSYGKIFTKFIFASNDELSLTRRKADTRRALYIALESYKGETDNRYLDKLWEEAPAIYALCLEKYRLMCPNDGPIVQSTHLKQQLEFDYANEMDRFFGTYFEEAPREFITGSQWQAAKQHYFGRKPTAQEERLLKDELLNRQYIRKKVTSGWVIYGLRKKSSLAIISEKSQELNPRSQWPEN